MQDGLQTLEDGDWVERNYAECIRQSIPLYETIWSRYIGHDGKGGSLPIPGLSDLQQRDREEFSQAHYGMMVALIHLWEICDDFHSSLGCVKTVSNYLRLQRDITSFMCQVGRVRDLMKKMDSALHLGGEVWPKFSDFYQQRNNVLHGSFPAQCVDEDGIVSIATPGGKCASEAYWLHESLFSESQQKRFVCAADFLRETLQQLVKVVNAASSRFLTELDSKMPGYVCTAHYKIDPDKLSVIDRTPTSSSLSAHTTEFTAASGCRVVDLRKRGFNEQS